jgi:hypothetical protein
MGAWLKVALLVATRLIGDLSYHKEAQGPVR